MAKVVYLRINQRCTAIFTKLARESGERTERLRVRDHAHTLAARAHTVTHHTVSECSGVAETSETESVVFPCVGVCGYPVAVVRS